MSTINYTCIIIDGTCLLLPEDDVYDIEPIDNVYVRTHGSEDCSFEQTPSKYPVHVIDFSLTPLEKCPSQRQSVVCFSFNEQLMGVACDEVTSAQFVSNYLFEKIPEMMKLPNSPIQALLYAHDQLYYITNAESLVGFLINQECCS